MVRGLIVLLAAGDVVTGCGSAGRHPTTRSPVSVQSYTLHEVKAAFAAQGVTLQKMLGNRRLVVLKKSGWFGPFGYQSHSVGRAGHEQPLVTHFVVFVGSGPHSEQRGNVWVAYSDGEGPTVRAALRQLPHSKQ